MIALEQARTYLEGLGLDQAAAVLENRLDAAANQQLPYADFLADLLGVEATARRQRYLVARTRLAHFPFQRTLDDFDFGFQPSIDERQVKELAGLSFAAEAANVLLLGPPGVGRSEPVCPQCNETRIGRPRRRTSATSASSASRSASGGKWRATRRTTIPRRAKLGRVDVQQRAQLGSNLCGRPPPLRIVR